MTLASLQSEFLINSVRDPSESALNKLSEFHHFFFAILFPTTNLASYLFFELLISFWIIKISFFFEFSDFWIILNITRALPKRPFKRISQRTTYWLSGVSDGQDFWKYQNCVVQFNSEKTFKCKISIRKTKVEKI